MSVRQCANPECRSFDGQALVGEWNCLACGRLTADDGTLVPLHVQYGPDVAKAMSDAAEAPAATPEPEPTEVPAEQTEALAEPEPAPVEPEQEV